MNYIIIKKNCHQNTKAQNFTKGFSVTWYFGDLVA